MSDSDRIRPLTQRGLLKAVRHLAAVDPDLARIVELFGPPPLWQRDTGFGTLLHMILEQQVSLASARAAFNRLSAAGPVTPEQLLLYDDDTLRAIGFSRQKAGYGRGLARAVQSGELNLDALAQLDDGAARTALVRLKGIGPWTADVYLLMALRRPDVWPVGDLALAAAARQVKRLRALPSPQRLEALGEHWRPWRAVAARLLWHHYLSAPRRRPP